MGLGITFEVAEPARETPRQADSYAYRMGIDDRVRIAATTEWGALSSLATLTQLGANGGIDVATVRDEPRFPWRGLMIDTVRHFISLDTLRRTLDGMWFYKLNVLHLHLTDDQGFRFRSEAYPELASPDSYSVPDLSRLVAYAADRGVRVVPELDVPGHATSWLAAHPEWAVPGSTPVTGPSKRFGVHEPSLDPDNQAVMAAVDTLLGELARVFPDDYIHFGGDEVAGLDVDAQHRFHRAVVERLAALGKRAIGWDECLSATLPAETVVQAWRGAGARDAALAAGYDCVVSSPYYLDLFYPADVHYAVDPGGDLVAAEKALVSHPRLRHVRDGLAWMARFAAFPDMPARKKEGRILGGEACLWSELVTDELLDTRLWSRMPAIAERLWRADADSSRDLDGFYERMAESRSVLAGLGLVAEDRAPIDVAPGIRPLVEMLEPVKWYRRLLGTGEYERRVSGLGGSADTRPYDVLTPLDRIVDRLAPESLASRRAEADLARGAPMDAWTAGWRSQRVALAEDPALQAEFGAASEALAALADVVDGKGATDPATLAGPFGEYLLPVAYAVKRR
ncbi:MAG: family 20 glycosylhydrolase [Gammaproteobacteria bacterium]|nr:family 20 glycosylhydrolase [Gammaproteobacteria bacterium]